MRCFIALPLPLPAREYLARRAAECRAQLATSFVTLPSERVPRLSWTRPEGYHLTLAFLGEIEAEAIELATKSLDAAKCAGSIPFSFGDLGGFPPKGPYRVLVSRLEEGGKSLELYRRVNEALEALTKEAQLPPLNEEYELERSGSGRGFSPHVTIARASQGPAIPRSALAEAEGREEKTGGEGWTIDRCALYKSELLRSGAVYTEIHAVKLD
jgi:2''-5'' RNA ligase